MSKLMYSESGGFATFPDHESPTGWVDGEPIRQKLLDAKRETATLPEVALQPLQDTKRRPGRPPKIAEEI